MSQEVKGKNLRLSFTAWQELRLVKFKLKDANTYSDVLEKVMDEYKGQSSLSDDVRDKAPSDKGDSQAMDTSDKTIVVSPKVHEKLIDLKNEYMIAKGFPARGPSAVSISSIIIDLMSKFKEKHGL